jgi:hypothetical protein
LGVCEGASQSQEKGEGELGGAADGCGHGTSPSRGLLRKVFEGETLGLDFGWLKCCVKWCSPACAGLNGVWFYSILGVKRFDKVVVVCGEKDPGLKPLVSGSVFRRAEALRSFRKAKALRSFRKAKALRSFRKAKALRSFRKAKALRSFRNAKDLRSFRNAKDLRTRLCSGATIGRDVDSANCVRTS